MDKFIIKFKNKEGISFGIKKYKIFYGNNNLKMFNIFRSIEQVLLKKINSEYFENVKQTTIYINDQKLNNLNTIYYQINPNFDIETDLKLGSKSLLLKYLEIKLNAIDYYKEFEVINKTLKEIENKQELQQFTFGEFQLDLNFNMFEIKEILKIIEPKIYIEQMNANFWDMSYEEIILYQLEIIKYISKNTDKNVVILFRGYITEKLLTHFNNLKTNNMFLIIKAENYHEPQDLKKYCLVNNKIIDLIDENLINYEILMELPYHCEKEDVDLLLKKMISNDLDSKTIELMKLL